MTVLGDPQFFWTKIEGARPLLPPEYVLREQKSEWVVAIAPNGRWYYVVQWRATKQFMLWRRVCHVSNGGRLQWIVDYREEIQLPQLQLCQANH